MSEKDKQKVKEQKPISKYVWRRHTKRESIRERIRDKHSKNMSEEKKLKRKAYMKE